MSPTHRRSMHLPASSLLAIFVIAGLLCSAFSADEPAAGAAAPFRAALLPSTPHPGPRIT